MQMANMETNAAYGCIQGNVAAIEENIYELDDVNPKVLLHLAQQKWKPKRETLKQRTRRRIFALYY